MDLEITVDDPEAFTKPVTVKIRENLLPDTDILEYICNEGGARCGLHLRGERQREESGGIEGSALGGAKEGNPVR